MVLVTGDCHGEFWRFREDKFPEQNEMTRDDFIIVCGDFGIWHDTEEEQQKFDWLAERPFTLLFVDGNHENFDRLYGDEFKIVDFHGGKAHKIRENVYHLMRGYVFDLCGKTFFAFGGARSHDIQDGILDPKDFSSYKEFERTYVDWYNSWKMFRVNHSSWWEQEMPSDEEMQRGLKILAENDNKVDFVITHCAPQHIVSLFSFGQYSPDKLTTYFNKVADTITFDKWYFGHYHGARAVTDKFIMLYKEIHRCV